MISNPAVDDLITHIQEGNETTRAKAYKYAFIAGPQALKPLAALMTGTELEVERAARRGMWRIVRHAGRPGANQERDETVGELLGLLGDDQPHAVRKEVVWMLSEIGGDDCVEPIAALLPDKDLREDARLSLQRIDGNKSLNALEAALTAAPDDFKLNIAQSLRARGRRVAGLPCEKLKPVRDTQVKPVGR